MYEIASIFSHFFLFIFFLYFRFFNLLHSLRTSFRIILFVTICPYTHLPFVAQYIIYNRKLLSLSLLYQNVIVSCIFVNTEIAVLRNIASKHLSGNKRFEYRGKKSLVEST